MLSVASILRREGVFEIPFPSKGIDQSQPRSKQPPGSCTYGLNVVGFPPLSDRLGGGKREGTRRAFTDSFENIAGRSNQINGLNATPNTASGSNTPSNAVVAPTVIYPNSTEAGYPDPAASWLAVGSATLHECTDEVGDYNTTDYAEAQPAVSGSFSVSEFRVGMQSAAGGPAAETLPSVSIAYRVTGVGPGVNESFDSSGSKGGASGLFVLEPAVETPRVSNGVDVTCSCILVLSLYYNSGGGDVLVRDFELVVNTSGDWTTDGFVLTQAEVDAITAGGAWTGADKLVLGVTASTAGPCGGVFFDVTQLTLSFLGSGGTAPPNYVTPGKVLALLDRKCYVGDLVADTEVTAATTLAKQHPQIDFYNGLWYCVDGGTQQTIDGTPTVTDWTATAGTIPDKCRLVAFYRDRAVLANQVGSSNGDTLYFMSAIGDPYDWRFAADDERPAEVAAVAGTNRFLGKPSDSITALIPWNDDQLIFGCASTMWKMVGDPGYGGTLMNLTQQTGVLGPRSWCFDEFGNLWFMGSGGLYMMTRDGVPLSVSKRRLYRFIDRINGENNLIQMVYDAFSKSIYIFISDVTQGSANLHIRYDLANDAFWFHQYARTGVMGPYSVCTLTGATDDDRRFLIGGADGYIRRPFDGALLDATGNIAPGGTQRWGTADDMLRVGTGGTAFNSVVRYAPVEYPMGNLEYLLTEMVAYGTDNNLPLNLPLGPVNWYVLTSDSASTIEDQQIPDAARSGQWFGPANFGQQLPVGMRVAAGCHQLMLRQQNRDQSWAIDRVVCKFTPGARRR